MKILNNSKPRKFKKYKNKLKNLKFGMNGMPTRMEAIRLIGDFFKKEQEK